MDGPSRGRDGARTPQTGSDADGPESMLGSIASLCAQATSATATDGAAVTILSAGGARELVYASNALAQVLDEIQFTAGVGPCVDAFSTGVPVECDDLTVHSAATWFGFSDEAVDAGVRGVFAFPLRGGDLVFGVLELYRSRPGSLTEDESRVARESAALIGTAALAAFVTEEAAETGVVVDPSVGHAEWARPRVNQAAGMASVQLDSTVSDAMARMRARAYSENRSLSDIADDIVTRRFRFFPTDDAGESGGGSIE